MSNFHSDYKKVGDLEFSIENLDDYFGPHKYGYRPVLKKIMVNDIPLCLWNGDTFHELKDAQDVLKKKIESVISLS